MTVTAVGRSITTLSVARDTRPEEAQKWTGGLPIQRTGGLGLPQGIRIWTASTARERSVIRPQGNGLSGQARVGGVTLEIGAVGREPLWSGMTWFTSSRERRLWRWALLILVAILTGAALAGSLVGILSSETWLGLSFAGGFALAVIAVLGLAFDRAERRPIWITVVVVVALAMVPVRSGLPAIERTHLFEYGLLAVVLYEALTERRKQTGGGPLPGLTAIGLTAGFGWLDEALQGWVPGRVYDLRDVGVNALAALVAVSVLAAVRRGRNVFG
jgi:hypothetical protein